MSIATPRKARGHKRHPSNLVPAISDYESDAAMAAQHPYQAPPPRTNTELNLAVLQRYVPSIFNILSIAANAVIYTFDSATEAWDKAGVEGTLFVCTQSPSDPNNTPRACVFVLNRRGLHNLIVDLALVSDVEIAGDLIILRIEGAWEGGDRVLGFWIHNDREETRQINAATIQECWGIVRSVGAVDDQRQEAGPAMQAVGRPLTMNDLFGSQAVSQGQ
ncbi:Dcp1-like decapping [Cordyceps militaris]|uniref:Dcp1-like decapping n=1 Tax=Cordyceps militaris TaxID=73501 RepID=A0A2H4SVL5_CORMI|nr:Dcp1-like decapping [Cordyceps militaris]